MVNLSHKKIKKAKENLKSISASFASDLRTVRVEKRKILESISEIGKKESLWKIKYRIFNNEK